MRKFRNICLIGYKCTGKTCVANVLGDKLNWKVYHINKIIQRNEDKSIKELTKDGTDWKYFRELEYKLLSELLQQDDVIIDCNEGVPVNEINMNEEFKLLANHKNTLKVWVKIDKASVGIKFRRKLEKIKKTKKLTKKEVYEYLKREYALMDKYNDIYENLADIAVKFSEFTDITKVLDMLKIQTTKI